jgi:hypothetical protein
VVYLLNWSNLFVEMSFLIYCKKDFELKSCNVVFVVIQFVAIKHKVFCCNHLQTFMKIVAGFVANKSVKKLLFVTTVVTILFFKML